MNSDLAKPETFQDIVRDRVRKIIMDAVPDGQIDSLVKKEYDAFFEDRVSTGYHKEVIPSDFKKMVQAEIKAMVESKIKEHVCARITNKWDSDLHGNKLLEEVTKAYAPLAMQSVMENIVSVSLNKFRDQLMSR